MRYIFLIASHINVEIRVETLRRALASIEASNPDHIYLSYSVDESYRGRHLDFENIWKQELNTFPYTIFYQPERKYQFEHYNILKDIVQDDDIVSFCDDDDLVHRDKVNILKKYFSDKNLELLIHNLHGFITPNFNKDTIDEESIDNEDASYNIQEYTCFNLKGILYKDWFNNTVKYIQFSFEEIVAKHKDNKGFIKLDLIDLMFRNSLVDNIKKIEISDKLYYYRLFHNIKKCYNYNLYK